MAAHTPPQIVHTYTLAAETSHGKYNLSLQLTVGSLRVHEYMSEKSNSCPFSWITKDGPIKQLYEVFYAFAEANTEHLAERLKDSRQLGHEIACRWMYLQGVKHNTYIVNHMASPHEIQTSVFYSSTFMDAQSKYHRRPLVAYVCDKELFNCNIQECYVRLGSRSFTHAQRLNDRLSAYSRPHGNACMLATLTSIEFNIKDETRVVIRRRVHFLESTSERFYLLLKRAEFLFPRRRRH